MTLFTWCDLLCLRCILVCDVSHEWVPYLFCAIAMCDSNVSTLQIASKPIALMWTISQKPMYKTAVARRTNRTVWTDLKTVCSHGATAICIDTYWNRTWQLHRMGMEPIHVWHRTRKCIAVSPYKQSHWHPHNLFFITIAFTKISHRVNEPWSGTLEITQKTLKHRKLQI